MAFAPCKRARLVWALLSCPLGTSLVAVGGELSVDSSNLRRRSSSDAGLGSGLLGSVELGGGFLADSLEATDELSVLPAELGSKDAEGGVLAGAGELDNAEGVGDHHALDLVIRRGDALEGLEPGLGLAGAAVLHGEHAADDAGEPLGGGALVDGTTLGVGVGLLAQELDVLELVADVCEIPGKQKKQQTHRTQEHRT